MGRTAKRKNRNTGNRSTGKWKNRNRNTGRIAKGKTQRTGKQATREMGDGRWGNKHDIFQILQFAMIIRTGQWENGKTGAWAQFFKNTNTAVLLLKNII
jgi:hypothetical protein